MLILHVAMSWKEFQQQKNQSNYKTLPKKPDDSILAGLNFDQIEVEFRKLVSENYCFY